MIEANASLSNFIMTKAKIFCYYITGHGLGHASRTFRLIDYLLNNDCVVHVVTNVLQIHFEQILGMNERYKSHFHFHVRALDTGAIQDGPLRVNITDTLNKYYDNIHCNHNSILLAEVDFIKNNNIQIVLADATPIACAAGKAAGCSAVILLTNFTWDSIYRMMFMNSTFDSATADKFNLMIEQCEVDSGSATIYMQLPGACPLPRGSYLCFATHSMYVCIMNAQGLTLPRYFRPH